MLEKNTITKLLPYTKNSVSDDGLILPETPLSFGESNTNDSWRFKT